MTAIFAGLLFIKKWINEALIGQRRWRCTVDGNFLVYFILLLLQSLLQVAVTIWISSTNQQEFIDRQENWRFSNSDDFYLIFVAIMINNLLNFVMTMFAIFMLEKMSRA